MGVGGNMFSGHPAVRPSVRRHLFIPREAISLCLMNYETWHKYFVTWVGVAEKVFKVRGQRLMLWQDQLIWRWHIYWTVCRRCWVCCQSSAAVVMCMTCGRCSGQEFVVRVKWRYSGATGPSQLLSTDITTNTSH